MLHTLAVLTVVYGNYTILDDFFASFEKQTDNDFRIFLADLTENKLRYPYPSFVTVIPGANYGYAHGINLGLWEASEEDYRQFAVINSDVQVSLNFVETVKKDLKNNPTSLIGGKIYYGAGHEYHKNRYRPEDLGHVLWYAGGECDWKNALTAHRGVDEVDKGQYDRFEHTDFITGCLMCFDRHVIRKIGMWDESYFLYYEDADYCERAKRNGISLFYDPSLVIWHKNAASTGGSGSSIHIKHQQKNRLVFGLKYAPIRTKLHLLKNFLFNRSRM